MSKYRCPMCGATHKEAVATCRLCGQSLAPDAIPSAEIASAPPLPRRRGIKGAMLLGLGVVLVVVVIAAVFGLARPSREVERAKAMVQPSSDGWSRQEDARGAFTVELPEKRQRQDVGRPSLTGDGKLVAWTAQVGTDTWLTVGYGTVDRTAAAASSTSRGTSLAGTQLYLRDTLAPRYAQAIGVAPGFVEYREGWLAGMPAVYLRTTQAKVKENGQDVFVQATLALNGTTLYVVEVRSIYKDASQFDRLNRTFAATGTATG